VIMPEHVIFPPDLEPRHYTGPNDAQAVSVLPRNDKEPQARDLSLESAVKRHVRFVYDQANRNQRRAAKLLGISRSTLARHLRELTQS